MFLVFYYRSRKQIDLSRSEREALFLDSHFNRVMFCRVELLNAVFLLCRKTAKNESQMINDI